MPKDTFKQLAREKRERVLRAAAGLFAERGYAGADMALVASRAGVAKGSLYNYFLSKEDLYLFVCSEGIARSRRAVYNEIEPHWDIYRQVEHIFRRGAEFVLAHPEYIRLYLNVSSAGMEHFADQLTLEVEKHTADYLKSLIREAVQKGTIRSNVDVNMAAFLINSIYVVFMVSLISRHFQIRMKEYLEIEGELNEGTVERSLNMIIGMIHRFLRPMKPAQGEPNP